MNQEDFGHMKSGTSPEVAKTVKKLLGKEGRIPVRLNDNSKTIIFVKPGKDIEEAKDSFLNRLDSYNSLSTKAAEAREKDENEV